MEQTDFQRWRLLGISILLQSFSFLSLKYATMQVGFLVTALVFLGLVFMACRALVWQRLLALADVSAIFPFASLVQVVILAYGVLLFGEQVTAANAAGFALMLAGVFLLSR